MTPTPVRIAAVFLAAALLAGCGQKEGPPKVEPEPRDKTDKRPAPSDKTPVVRDKGGKEKDKGTGRPGPPSVVDAGELVRAFAADNKSAYQRYGTKEVTVAGVVRRLSESRAVVYLGGEEDESAGGLVVCTLKEEERKTASSLREGQPVEVHGLCAGKAEKGQDVVLVNVAILFARDDAKARKLLKSLGVEVKEEKGRQAVTLGKAQVTADGHIRREVLAALRELVRLRDLSAEDTPLGDAGLKEVGGLKGLESLVLDKTKVSDAGLAHVAGLTRLRKLSLSSPDRGSPGVSDAGLEHVKGLTALEVLRLGSGKVSDAGLARLAGLTRLTELDLGETGVTGAGLARLKGLKELRVLFLPGTRIDDAGLANLKGLTKLQRLNLANTPVTDAGLEHLAGLTALESLHLKGTKVTDAGLKYLAGLKKLNYLSLSRKGGPTQAGVEKLKQALPDLAVDQAD
jgi:hypothetical protein